jgi:hypothetical protein
MNRGSTTARGSLAIDILTEHAENNIDQALNAYVQACNSALAVSDLTLHRKFTLTERGLRRLVRHADRTRRQLKREADRIRRRRAR